MRIRPRVLLAKYLVSSTVQFLDVRSGIRVFIIYFPGMIQNSYDSNGYDSNGYDSNGYDSHQSLRKSEYSVKVIILGARRLVYSLYMIQPSPMTKNTRSGFQWDVVDILGK